MPERPPDDADAPDDAPDDSDDTWARLAALPDLNDAPIDDPAFRRRLARERTLRPLRRERHVLLDVATLRAAGRADVEHHRDVGAEVALHLHRDLRRHALHRAVEVGFEGDAVLVDLPKRREAEDLKAAAVGEHRVRPAHEARHTPELRHQLRAGAQPEVVGVRQDDARAGGLDYPGVGPEHAHLADIGRARYPNVTDQEVVDAFRTLTRTEGIIPALEPAHALAWVIREAPALAGRTVLINLSGRGDKDVAQIMDLLEGEG